MNVQYLREEIQYIRAVLSGSIAPFISSLLARPRIVATGGVEIAGVDDCTMYINPEGWGKLSFPDRVYAAAHEAVHLAFSHPARGKARRAHPRLWNIAADAVVWVILSDLVQAPLQRRVISPAVLVPATGVPQDEISRMTVEEIYDLLLKRKWEGETWILDGDLLASSPEGEVVQEGDPRASDPEAWKEWVRRAETLQRMAGRTPAGLERAVRDFLLPKLDPRALIRSAIRVGLGKVLVGDWKRPSKRYPGLPGVKRFTMPDIWALVDTSGSISEDDLRLELGVVYEFSKMARIHVIAFDAKAYDEVTAKSPSEVVSKVAKMLKGGGGTEVFEALKNTAERMRYKDVVLVITDGHIYDLDSKRTRAALQQVSSQAGLAAFLTIDAVPRIPGWQTITVRRRG